MGSSSKLVTACVQARAHDRDAFSTRLPALLALIEHAAEQAELVVAPECTVPAYCIGKEPIDRKQITQGEEAIKAIARRHKTTIVYGTARIEGNHTFNSAFVIGPTGERLGYADKRFLWHFDRLWFTPGQTLEPISTPIGRLGILICADGRIPTLAAALRDRGAEILVVPTAWVTSGRNQAALENIQADLFTAVRARENGIPLIAANKVGTEQRSVAYCGKSQIVNAAGSVLARASETEECIISAQIHVGIPQPRASSTTLPCTESFTPRTAKRIALTASDDPREVRALARQAAFGDADVLIARTDALISAELPILNVASIEPEHAALARIGNLDIGIVGSSVFCNPHALTRARLAGIDLFLWPGLADTALSLAFTRTRAVELRASVITLTDQRVTACDPDGTIVCGTYDDYRVAAFAHDSARCAQGMVAPHTDVLAGLRTAMTMLYLIIALLLTSHRAGAETLPARLDPPTPFPTIIAQSFEQEDVTLGVHFGQYYLMTVAGPLVIHAITVDLREPTIRLNTVLANDHLISKGETISSMALRTGAVAGINADFFDIGNTYQPIGIIVQDGLLLRSPSVRAVMTITKDRTVRFETFRFGGEVRDQDGRTWRLSAMNEWPAHDGISFLTPAFGAIPAQAGDMLIFLTPLEHASTLETVQYRVAVIADANVPHTPPTGPVLAFGPAAMSENGIPKTGNILDITENTDPPLNDVATAVGGGPLLLRNGMPYDDPYPPAPHNALRRVPLTGALCQDDGTLVFVQVDGRAPHLSIGLTRPEFTALLRALGGTDGMAFDGGGSSTIVARTLGKTNADVRNTPSDGRERPVTDGMFIYSNAALGPPARLALRYRTLRILQGAQATLNAVVLDDAGHVLNIPTTLVRESVTPPTLARILPDGRLIAGNGTKNGFLHLERRLETDGTLLATDVALDIVDRIATLRIAPEHPNPQPGEDIMLHAMAFNSSGAPIDIDGRVLWQTTNAAIEPNGMYHAGSYDTMATARVGNMEQRMMVRVGNRTLPLDIFRHDGPAARAWNFMSSPLGLPGSTEIDEDDALALSYDFTGDERAAYANTDITLDGDLLALSVDVQGDDNGEALRVALSTPDSDRIPITLAHHIDWQGWRTLTMTLPTAAIAAQTLNGFYLVAPDSTTAQTHTSASGTIALRNLRGIFAGTSTPIPPYHVQASTRTP
jgi:predicted amidohydrolase